MNNYILGLFLGMFYPWCTLIIFGFYGSISSFSAMLGSVLLLGIALPLYVLKVKGAIWIIYLGCLFTLGEAVFLIEKLGSNDTINFKLIMATIIPFAFYVYAVARLIIDRKKVFESRNNWITGFCLCFPIIFISTILFKLFGDY